MSAFYSLATLFAHKAQLATLNAYQPNSNYINCIDNKYQTNRLNIPLSMLDQSLECGVSRKDISRNFCTHFEPL